MYEPMFTQITDDIPTNVNANLVMPNLRGNKWSSSRVYKFKV